MRAFAKLVALILFAAPAAAFAQSAEGLRPSDPAAIAAAAQSCSNALPAEHLDEQRLTADGWSAAQMRQENGHPVDAPLRFFGRNSILLIVMPDGSGCAIVASLRSLSVYPAVVQALRAQLGEPARTNPGGEFIWLAGDKVVQANATGSRERPAARIVIIHVGNSH